MTRMEWIENVLGQTDEFLQALAKERSLQVGAHCGSCLWLLVEQALNAIKTGDWYDIEDTYGVGDKPQEG